MGSAMIATGPLRPHTLERKVEWLLAGRLARVLEIESGVK